MFDELEKKKARHDQLQGLIADPKVISDKVLYKKYAKELADLTETVSTYNKYLKITRELEEIERELQDKRGDPEYIELAKKEKLELRRKSDELTERLEEALLEKEMHSERNAIMEIRAGTGGIEAGLFAADLFRMYSKYAAKMGWKIEVLSSSLTEKSGFKEIIFSISGKDVYGKMRLESGTHRVQRVPVTEAGGRIHTSAVTVAVLAEPEELDLEINPKDLKIDVFRAGGRGGQHVNVTDSAVRITHLPTGLVISCQDERSQHKNKSKAMKVLRARLLERKEKEQMKKISLDRKKQIGTGDRSEKIRTYNFPGRRVTDHRIGLALHGLDNIIEGDLDGIIRALKKADRQARLGKSPHSR